MKYFPEDGEDNLITLSFILNTWQGQVQRVFKLSYIHSPTANLNMTIQIFGLGLFCWFDFYKLDTNYESSAKWVFQLKKYPYQIGL